MAEQDNEFSPARAATRAPIGRTIRLQFDDSMDVVEALCVNISIGGMFVAIQKARPKGSLVRFELVLDEQRSVRGLGEVIWMRPPGGPDREAGIGVKFRFLEQRERQLIFKLVSQHIKERLSKKPIEPLGLEEPGLPEASRPSNDPQAFESAPAVVPDAWPPEPPQAAPPVAARPWTPPRATDDQPPEDPPRAPRALPLRAPAPVPEVDAFDLEPAMADLPARTERPPPSLLDADRPTFDQLFGDRDALDLEPLTDLPEPFGQPRLSTAPAPGLAAATPEDGTDWDGGSLWDEGLGGEEHAPELHRGTPARRRRAVPALAIGGLLVALAAIGFFLYRAGIFEPAAPMVALAPPPPPVAAIDPPASDEPAPPGIDEPGAEVEPAAVVEPPPPAAVVEPPPPLEPRTKPKPTAEPRRGSAFSKLLDVVWERDPRGLKVVLSTDGEVLEGSYRHFRLDGDQPREVVRLLGAAERFDRTELAVGSPELTRIRTGFHREGGEKEVRVVLDLAASDVGIVSIEPRGARLEIILGKL